MCKSGGCDPCGKSRNSGGNRGPQGFEGRRGPMGHIGIPGPAGTPGAAGLPGAIGPMGLPGPAGASGLPGSIGPQGIPGLPGTPGPAGAAGNVGPKGATGLTGDTGPAGSPGLQGIPGPIGAIGPAGAVGPIGVVGPIGLTGATGAVGPIGPVGLPGPSFSIARFYGLAPSDYPATIAIGTALAFPQNGVNVGTDVVRIGAAEFNLVSIGVYRIDWQTTIKEPGQLTLWGGLGPGTSPVSGGRFADSTVGRATGTSQFVGGTLIKTSFPNQHIGVFNDASPAAITVTPLAGGTESVSSWLIIQRVS